MKRVALIGLGQMGRLHLSDCMHIRDVKVVGAADPSKRALNRAKALGVANIYEGYKELLENQHKDLDAVIISVPNYLHLETIELALENGLNVFVEKPMAINATQCEEIVKLVQHSGRRLMVGHNLRFVPAVEEIKKNLDRGVIGNLEVATIEEILNGPFSHPHVPAPVPDWWFDPQKSGGGALLDLGYHLIDLFRFFTEEDAKVVFADLSYKYNLPIEEGATIILLTEASSIRGILNVGWYQRSVFPKYNFRAILHGDSGYLSTEDLVPRRIYVHAAKEGLKNIFRRVGGRKLRELSYTYYWESYFKELTAFFESLEKDIETPITAADGLKTVQVIEDAYRFFNATNEGKTNEK